MHKLYESVCEELKALEKKATNGDLSMSEIQLGDTLAHFGKNLKKMMEDEDEEYSGAMYPDGRGSYRYDNGGMSMARGRGRNARRDSMGRYSSEGYSRATDETLTRMHEMMRNAPDEQTRQEVQRMINRLEQM